MGFELIGPSAIVYATWEDSPEQIRGRLYWLEQAGKVGDGHNNPAGLTPASKALRLAAAQHDARRWWTIHSV